MYDLDYGTSRIDVACMTRTNTITDSQAHPWQAQAAWQGGYHAQAWSQYGAAGAQLGQPSAMASYSSGAYAPEATL